MSYLRKSFLITFILTNLLWLAAKQWALLKKVNIVAPHQIKFNALFKDVHWSEYDAQGMVTHRFYAPMVKNISNEKNIIYSPLIELHNDKETWTIKAMYAKTIKGYDTIELQKDVNIKHLAHQQSIPSFLNTEHLTYLPKTQEAFTDKKVVFNQGDNIIHAKGMNANFANSAHIKLGQVDGTYQPQTPSTS